MNYEIYFKYMFESIPHYRKTVIKIFLIKNDEDLLKEYGFLKSYFNRLNKEFEIISMEEIEKYFIILKIKKKLLSNGSLINKGNNILL